MEEVEGGILPIIAVGILGWYAFWTGYAVGHAIFDK
jgi:hypothetical protein